MGCRAFDLHAGPDAPGPVERQRGAEVRSLRICGARGGVESKNRRIEIRSSAQPAASCFVRPRFSNARNREFTPCELAASRRRQPRSEEHTSELQSLTNLVCRLLLEKKKT